MFQLQHRDITVRQDSSPSKRHAIVIDLHDRKSVNYRESKFAVYIDRENPQLCPYTYFMLYLDELKREQKSFMPQAIVFPRMTIGKFYSGLEYSAGDFSVDLRKSLDFVGIDSVDYGSHSLRTGGCHYYLMYAKNRWTIDQIKYWAGWSTDTDSRILGTYLLDELCRLKFDKMSQVMQEEFYEAKTLVEQLNVTTTMVYDLQSELRSFKNELREVLANNSNNVNLAQVPAETDPNIFIVDAPMIAPAPVPQVQQPLIFRPQNPSQTTISITTRPAAGINNSSLSSGRKRGRAKKIRNLEAEDGCVDIKKVFSMADVVIQCENGYPVENIKPLLQWTENAKNYRKNIARYLLLDYFAMQY